MAQRPILERKNVFGTRLIERRAAQLGLSRGGDQVYRLSAGRVVLAMDFVFALLAKYREVRTTLQIARLNQILRHACLRYARRQSSRDVPLRRRPRCGGCSLRSDHLIEDPINVHVHIARRFRHPTPSRRLPDALTPTPYSPLPIQINAPSSSARRSPGRLSSTRTRNRRALPTSPWRGRRRSARIGRSGV